MVLDSAVQTCQLNADEGNVEIVLDCEDKLQFRMNSTLMEQAIVNLLVNAIKYSKSKGQVKVSARKEQIEGEEQVRIEVKDDGIGIAREHLPRLFERFYRSDNVITSYSIHYTKLYDSIRPPLAVTAAARARAAARG